MQANATKVQRRLLKPRTPAQRAADVVGHVLATEGESYLDTAEHLYTWWQLALLDIYIVILICVAALLAVVGLLGWWMFQLASSTLGKFPFKHKPC